MSIVLRQKDQILDDAGDPIVNGYFYVGEQGQDPKTNPINIYADDEYTVALANPQRTDTYGRVVNDIYVQADGYSYLISNSADTTIEGPFDRGVLGNGLGASSITQETVSVSEGETSIVLTNSYTEGAVTVSVNGVDQSPLHYTAPGGNTITFTEALPEGEVIVTIFGTISIPVLISYAPEDWGLITGDVTSSEDYGAIL
jgi:hypothetical protein